MCNRPLTLAAGKQRVPSRVHNCAAFELWDLRANRLLRGWLHPCLEQKEHKADQGGGKSQRPINLNGGLVAACSDRFVALCQQMPPTSEDSEVGTLFLMHVRSGERGLHRVCCALADS